MEQPLLFDMTDCGAKRPLGRMRRNDPLFLRNQFQGDGHWGIPVVRKQRIRLKNLNLIASTNTIPNDEEYFDFGVHFFVDDHEFGDVYENPEKTYSKYSQYAFCCTPDYSVYGEMPLWRQLESVAHSRWCGAWWQSKGMKVVPTISWDKYQSYDFCFEGVERGSVVAVATYACHQDRAGFVRGYAAMLEHIQPDAIICYGSPFPGMSGNLIEVPVCNPRQFHRELRRRKVI